MMETLQDMLSYPDPIVADTAERILVLQKHVADGDMSTEEYNELMADLVDAQRLNAIAAGLQTQNTINAVFSKLFALASLII
jgi:polyhydroxyalkanoate synthesis regulator phasin